MPTCLSPSQPVLPQEPALQNQVIGTGAPQDWVSSPALPVLLWGHDSCSPGTLTFIGPLIVRYAIPGNTVLNDYK